MDQTKFPLGALAGVVLMAGSAAATAQSASNAASNASSRPATAAAEESGGALEEIVVTAQKREQSINDVGLTIQAASEADLASRGIDGPDDLSKLVPGLTFTKSIFSTPVYTLRGVGLYDATWGAVPAVAIYTDQVPRDSPVMSDGLDLDIQRVEVLKGPQGTLFGQSSTGGAVNYILNKPTKDFESSATVSVERFGKQTFEGAISGPISDTLQARFAARSEQGGDWQYSVSRPYDENGASRKLIGRFMLDWEPIEQLTAEATFTASQDHSDNQAPQFIATLLNTYSAAALAAANANPATANPYGVVNNALYNALTNPKSPGYNGSFLGQQAVTVGQLNSTNPAFALQQAGALAVLSAKDEAPNARAADWTPGLLGPSDNVYYQGTLRLDYKLGDNMTLSSITAFQHKSLAYGQDLDATPAEIGDVTLWGHVKSINEEIHLTGNTGNLNWIAGADFDNVDTVQNNYYDLRDYASNDFGIFPCASTKSFDPNACKPGPYGGPYAYINITENDFSSDLKSYAAFGNLDFKFNSNLSAQAGVRFTDTHQTATYCYNDPAIDLNQGTNYIFSNFLLNPGLPQLTAGQCFPSGTGTVSPKGAPTYTPLTPPALVEDNVSFRTGLDYKLDQGTLFYATISQGYKAGLFSEIGASNTGEYVPAQQEKLVDYEVGFKAPLLDHRLEVNGAVFDYQYSNKQVRARELDPVYGLLEIVVNIPKSRVYGAEFDVQAVPIQGLRLSASGTYLNTDVTSDFSTTQSGVPVYNAQGYTGDFKGATLPFSPKFSANADAEYAWSGNGKISPYVGASAQFQTSENTTFANSVLLAPDFNIASYTTMDARAGLRAADGKWDVMAYCHNCTNRYYVTSVSFYLDDFERFTGMPTVYGIRAHWNF